MTIHPRAVCVAGALAAAALWACSDDGAVAPDTGVDVGSKDHQVGDGKKPVDGTVKPDIPTKPGKWVTVKGVAPKLGRHTATLLKDGRVLITGGMVESPTTHLRAAYLYDPGKDTFLSAGQMSVERGYHSASLLPDGRVLIVGGTGKSTEHSTTEIYDPKKPAATAWAAGPPLGGPRWGHAAVTLNNGKVLVVGGGGAYPSYLASMAIYTPPSNSWSLPATAMGSKRAYPGAALLPSGKVLIVSGYNGVYLDTVEVYDPSNGKITPLSSKLSYGRSLPTVTRLLSDKILIVGGKCGYNCAVNDELYDPISDKLIALTHPGGPPANHAAARLKDGRVLICGGLESAHQPKVLLYNPYGGGSWDPQPNLAHGRYRHTATLLKDGSVLVVGGRQTKSDSYLDRAERFVP